ncbi:MAG: NAD-dependent epimerase/dehydratase family protein [Rhodomicrobium sp.]
MRRILLTGAAGKVGSRLRLLLQPAYDLVLSDIEPPADLGASETFIAADLAEAAAIERATAGVEGIIHLGGQSVEAPWETILRSNIVGTYNLFEAARKQGVKRVVYASSNHAVGFYPRSETIGTAVLPLPDTRYGVSKAFGEALGALYAYKYGLGVLCIRIGNVSDAPADERRLAIWLKPEDLVSLIRIGLEREDLLYEVVYGMSDNARRWWDNSRAHELGYQPAGRSGDFASAALAAQAGLPADEIGDRFQGGSFCSEEFQGPLSRIVPKD